MVNVYPLNDEKEHILTVSCECGPEVSWVNSDGSVYANGPLIIHNSFDGREFVEEFLEESLDIGKIWEVVAD